MPDQKRQYVIDYRAIGDGPATAARMRAAMESLAPAVATARGEFVGLRADLEALKPMASVISRLATAAGVVGLNAKRSSGDLREFSAAAGDAASKGSGFRELQGAIQSAQRSAYGLKMNAAEAAKALGDVGATAGKFGPLKDRLGELNPLLKSTAGDSKGLGRGIGAAVAALAGFTAGRAILTGVGEAIAEARDRCVELAEKALKTRDALRELANLKGESGPNDKVVGETLRLRAESGMNAGEAAKFQEQFLGSLPLAKDKGGITDGPNGVADPLSRKVAALAVRTGLDGGTAGDLAGVMGSFQAVPNANVGLGRVQQIVDQLNDGRGNLTPLTKELLKNAAGTVGPGNVFGTLQERAAAVATSTGLGAIGSSSSRIDQAVRGLGRYSEDSKAGETLRGLGVSGKDDFLARLEKIAPLVESAKAQGKTPDDVLKEAGFGNLTERRTIAGFVANREVLRKRTLAVRDAGDGKANAQGIRAERLNAAFLGTDKAARDRVARANLDRAEFEKGKQAEDLVIERKNAEASLLDQGKIDTPWSNFQDRVNEGFGLGKLVGGQSGREQRIDAEIQRRAGQKIIRNNVGDTAAAAKKLAARRAAQFQAQAAPQDGPGGPVIPAIPKPALQAQGQAPPPAVGPDPGAQGQGQPNAGGGGGMLAKLDEMARLLLEANRQRQEAQDRQNPIGGVFNVGPIR